LERDQRERGGFPKPRIMALTLKSLDRQGRVGTKRRKTFRGQPFGRSKEKKDKIFIKKGGRQPRQSVRFFGVTQEQVGTQGPKEHDHGFKRRRGKRVKKKKTAVKGVN